MNVILTQPLTSLVKGPPRIPDLGLGYVAASLVRSGHRVDIIDWNMKPDSESLRRRIAGFKPDLVGVKVFTKDVFAAKKTLALIRETVPDALTIIGGPHPSCVEDPAELMADFEGCYFAMRGEAERSFPLLLDAISKKSPQGFPEDELKNVPGLVWRGAAGISANDRFLNDDLDGLGFPLWEKINPNNYHDPRTAPIITTRGCPGKCTFCSAFNINGRRIRSRNVDRVFEEISMLYNKYGIRNLMFQDNCFTQNHDNLMSLCEKMISNGIDVEWDCVTYERLDNLTRETLSTMYRAGCRMVHMGIESGSVKTRKVMNKWCALPEIHEKVQLMKECGIKISAFFMLGFPGETKADMKDTIDYAYSLRADLLTFTICYPLPGSRVYKHIKEKYGFDRIDWATFDINSSPYPASEVSSRDISRMLKPIRLRLLIERKFDRIKSLLGMK